MEGQQRRDQAMKRDVDAIGETAGGGGEPGSPSRRSVVAHPDALWVEQALALEKAEVGAHCVLRTCAPNMHMHMPPRTAADGGESRGRDGGGQGRAIALPHRVPACG
eukprot:4911027-Prymnesium_polylepis.1